MHGAITVQDRSTAPGISPSSCIKFSFSVVLFQEVLNRSDNWLISSHKTMIPAPSGCQRCLSVKCSVTISMDEDDWLVVHSISSMFLSTETSIRSHIWSIKRISFKSLKLTIISLFIRFIYPWAISQSRK